jgi:CheY-like chemotaxis protein
MILILVADDYEDTRQMLRMLLELKGCRVMEAENGLEAVSLASRIFPDLILMDLNMPALDGFAAARRIREQVETQHIPIVAVTAEARGDWRKQAMAAGCDDCIEKPVDFDVLDRLLSSFLGKRLI